MMSSQKSPEFSDFMLGIINNGDFTAEDAEIMKTIKERENKENVIEDKERVYLQRITATKQKKMNRLFIFLKKILGLHSAVILVGKIKKLRAYPLMK